MGEIDSFSMRMDWVGGLMHRCTGMIAMAPPRAARFFLSHMYMYVCTYVCMYVYIYIYIYIGAHSPSE